MNSDKSEKSLTHLDQEGNARMVDVGNKADTQRMASAEGFVYMSSATFEAVQRGDVKKGDVLTVARIAGMMGAKNTANLIPLCHPLPLSHIDIELKLRDDLSAIQILATTRTTGKTGVEMEALTAVCVTALTIYDMAKALDRGMKIDGIRLIEKRGGKSGHFRAEADNDNET